MTEFQVPQFIEEETKIIGPLTLRQFFIFMGAGIVSFVFFFIFQTWLWALLTFFLAIVVIGLSFGKVHGRPASDIAVHALKFFWQPRLYLWKKQPLKAEELYTKKEKPSAPSAEQPVKKEETKVLTPEKIKELAKQLNRQATK